MCILKFTKGHNSIKRVGEVMVLVLCTWSDKCFIFVPGFAKVSQRVSELQNRKLGRR